MIYIKRATNADITRQIDLTKETAMSFFRYDSGLENARALLFKDEDSNNEYSGTIKKSGHTITITGDIFSYVKKTCSFGDIIVFSSTKKNTIYKFHIVKISDSTFEGYDHALSLFGSRSGAIDETTHLIATLDDDILENSTDFSYLQVIFYGAPGTGKSYKVNELTNKANSVRTTFHPDSDYSTFVGAYKPTTQQIPLRDLSGHIVYEGGQIVIDERIIYKFVPQAFLHAYVNAWKNQSEPYYLVIEEINRGNCAQIFGDLFQLLDRGANGESSYSIKPDKDIETFLANDELGFKNTVDIPNEIKNGEEMRLPSNLRIFATMNTSDQSLFPIDSAFKRRWDWEYVPIENARKGHYIVLGGKKYDWWTFISIINDKIDVLSGSEDKKMGYWFVKPTEGSREITAKQFLSKVLFYLWNDIYKDYADSSQSIFRIKQNDQPIKASFTSFFGKDSVERMQAFMEYNGIPEIETIEDDDLLEQEELHEDESVLEFQSWYENYWDAIHEELLKKEIKCNAVPKRNYDMFTLGKTNISLLANVNRKGECWIGAYIEKAAANDYYPKLVEHKEEINTILGEGFEWIENEEYSYRSIRISRDFGSFTDDSNKAASQNWVAEGVIKYLPLFKEIVAKYL